MHWWKFCQQLNFFRRCGSWELSRFYSLLISIMMWSHRARTLQSRFYPLANNVVTTVPPSTIELHFWFFVPMLFLATFPPNHWTVRSTTRRNNFRPLIFHMWVYEFPRRNIDTIWLWAQNNSLFHQAKLRGGKHHHRRSYKIRSGSSISTNRLYCIAVNTQPLNREM